MTAYEALQEPVAITYNIGSTTLTGGKYQNQQSPACGYSEVVTVPDLPPWVTHNAETADFTIGQTSDATLIGEHVFTIISEIQMPTNYTRSQFTTKTLEYEMTIIVKPCLLEDIIVAKIDKFSYTIGELDSDSDPYDFIQVPQCNYDMSVSV